MQVKRAAAERLERARLELLNLAPDVVGRLRQMIASNDPQQWKIAARFVLDRAYPVPGNGTNVAVVTAVSTGEGEVRKRAMDELEGRLHALTTYRGGPVVEGQTVPEIESDGLGLA